MPIIEVKAVSKKYNDALAVNDVSFTIEKCEIFGIIGANGAGKTTLLETMMGVRKPTTGCVKVLGLDVQDQNDQVKQRIGILFQETSVHPRIKVKEVLELFASYYSVSIDPAILIEKLELAPYQNAIVKKLSGGLKQRVLLALAFINAPDIIFLDEPTTGLDPQVRNEIWRYILQFKEQGGTVLLSTHYMDEVSKYCDRVLILKDGVAVKLDTPGRLIGSLSDAKADLNDVYMKYAARG